MWDSFDADQEKIPNYKLATHVAQIALALVLWCLELAVFNANNSSITGDNGWTFGVCFLSIPAWVYLIGTPRFPRTRRFASPAAMLVVDALFTVIWLSAFATQAAYNTKNLCGDRCNLSKAIVALGVFVCLLFGVSTFISIWTLKSYQYNGSLPGYENMGNRKPQNIDPDKAAFSMAPHDEEAYAPIHNNDDDEHLATVPGGSTAYTGAAGRAHSPDDSYVYGAPSPQPPVGGHANDPYGLAPALDNPFSRHHGLDDDTEYHAVGGAPPAASHHEAYEGPAKFPDANYDRIGRFGVGGDGTGR